MQCKAKAKSTGKPCRRNAIAGGTVCQVHGGAAPQVKRKAAERLRALVHPAIDRLEKTIEDESHPQTALASTPAIVRHGFEDVVANAFGRVDAPLHHLNGVGLTQVSGIVAPHLGLVVGEHGSEPNVDRRYTCRGLR